MMLLDGKLYRAPLEQKNVHVRYPGDIGACQNTYTYLHRE